MPEGISRRSLITGAGALVIAATATSQLPSPLARAATLTSPLPLGWCVDVDGASTVDGAKIVQWPGTGGANQDWRIVGL